MYKRQEEELTPLERELAAPPREPEVNVERLTAQKTWETAREPMHADIDTKKACGVGPGLVFGRMLAREMAQTVRLVPCAVGGSRIDEWGPNAELYVSMVERTRFALGKGASSKILLWMQGESDALKQEDVAVYRDRLRAFLKQVRADLGEDLVIVGIIVCGVPAKLPFIEEIRAIQRQVFEDDGRILVVDAGGLELRSDNLHLTTTSTVHVGKMIAEQVLKAAA